MQLLFGDEELERLAYEPTHAAAGWSTSLTRSYRRVVNVIASAIDQRDLEALHSLHVQRATTKGVRGATLRVDDKHRLRVSFPDQSGTPTARIEAIEHH